MNVIDRCLRDIRRHIPERILKAAFLEEPTIYARPSTSLDEEIRRRIIDEYLIPDISSFGQYQEVDIGNCPSEPDPVNPYARIYYLTSQMTGGREILAAHIGVTPVVGSVYTTPPIGSYLDANYSGVSGATRKLIDSNSPVPRISTPQVRVLGPNAISIQDPGMYVMTNKVLVKYKLSNELNEIKPDFYPTVAKLAVMACKQYIYNNIMMDIEQGKIMHGYEMGVFQDIVSNYSDSAQQYDDTLPQMQRELIHNDDIGNQFNYMSGGRMTS